MPSCAQPHLDAGFALTEYKTGVLMWALWPPLRCCVVDCVREAKRECECVRAARLRLCISSSTMDELLLLPLLLLPLLDGEPSPG